MIGPKWRGKVMSGLFRGLVLASLLATAGASVASAAPRTFAERAAAAAAVMKSALYTSGAWRACTPKSGCGTRYKDWGADAMTYALHMRGRTASDPDVVPMMRALNATGPTYGTCTAAKCPSWSDTPLWDAIAALREHQVTGEASALARARQGFDFVDLATRFALGACPTINYQRPGGGAGYYLKTLETDSNYIKAALLLYEVTGEARYLTKASAKYAAVRRYFLDPAVPLYTVYVFDQGGACTQLPRRFYASVNGNMIWNGLHLSRALSVSTYRADALATARAVADRLADAAGVFANLQAENDVAEPLVEAMYELALDGQAFARDWILTNAAASASAVSAAGTYGRFFNGPPPTVTTIWQSNGGFALTFAAAGLNPNGVPALTNDWSSATFAALDIRTLPATVTFTGRAIALVGALGDVCCEPGHARVFIDGVETFDRRGIWQNKSSSRRTLPGSILFAWRWPAAGTHTLTFRPADTNAKEGGSYLHLTGRYVVP
jgi:hypothetical protein